MWLSVFTQTFPFPPPAAGSVRAAFSVLLLVEVVAGALDAGLGDVCGLKKSARVFFCGEADALASGEAEAPALDLWLFFAGEAEASVAAGEVLVSAALVSAFDLRLFFAAGEADASAAGEALPDADALVSVFCLDLCFAGEAVSAGEGDCALASAAPANVMMMYRAGYLIRMPRSLVTNSAVRKGNALPFGFPTRSAV